MSSNAKICPRCRRHGHRLNAILVKTVSDARYLRYCICCGAKLPRRRGLRASAKARSQKSRRKGPRKSRVKK